MTFFQTACLGREKQYGYLLILTLGLLACETAQVKHSEKFYQERWCNQAQGKSEVPLPDKTRCDCITTNNAIEFDFAPKWAEAIGQSLHYSQLTGKRAGIVLIIKNNGDKKHLQRLYDTINYHKLPIEVWLTDAVQEP